MKNTLKKYVLFLLLILAVSAGKAQSADAVQLDTYTLDEDQTTVRVSIKTSESFIVAANRYVLHIGGRHFLRNVHPDGRLDEIVFLIPLNAYETLPANGRMVLVYGYYYENTLLDQEGNENTEFVGLNWELGKFTPQELTEE